MDIAFGKSIPFEMWLADDVTLATGKRPVVQIIKEGGTPHVPYGQVIELGNGWYAIRENQYDTDTPGTLCLTATADGCDPWQQAYTILPKEDPRDMRRTEAYLDSINAALEEIITQNEQASIQNEKLYKRNY